MCIAFPGKILSIDKDNMAMVDIGGTRLAVSLELLDENVGCGDYVISHAGFAIHKVNEATAQENLVFLKELHTHEIY